MKSWNPATCSARFLWRAGFVRYDWMLLVAVLVVILAVILPQFHRHGWLKGLLALLLVGFWIVAAIALMVLLGWLVENVGRAGDAWRDRLLRGLGHLLRFMLFGLIAAILGVALVAEHGLGVLAENAVSVGCGLVGGLGGCLFRRRLGPQRFWVAFRRFCLALLASFVGGILGILGPENWGVSLGVLTPILLFIVLAAFGRIVPRGGDAPSDPGGA